jgi:thioredoxin reductase (NADPH)
VANYDLVVIGEGVAGLTCANEAARAGLKVATFESNLFGGLVINIAELEGYPEGRQTSGAEFASELVEANANLNIASVQEPVESIAPGGSGFALRTTGGGHQARQVIAASGARLKKLGVPGEAEYEGRGVSQCADCDGPMFQDETVVVVGGGDAALQEALVLAKYVGKVQIAHRGERFRARPHFVEQVGASPKISVMWNTAVDAILGTKMVEKVTLRDTKRGQTKEMACAGVFVCIGLEPSSQYLPPDVKRDERGFVVTADGLETSVPGIWAIGAVRSGYSGLLKDAAAEAQQAAKAAAVRLKG